MLKSYITTGERTQRIKGRRQPTVRVWSWLLVDGVEALVVIGDFMRNMGSELDDRETIPDWPRVPTPTYEPVDFTKNF